MPSVTCPRCQTRQTIDDEVSGYTCRRCGTAWVFATCERCGSRFHMPPGTTSWTCPNCGLEHAPPPVEHPAPAHAAAQRAPAERDPRSGRRTRLGTIAVAGIAVVVIGSFLLSRGGSSAEPSPTVDPIATLCLHMDDLQTPRVDAFTRVAPELKADADAIAATGNQQLADAVLTLRRAVVAYRNALQNQTGNDSAPAAAMAAALSNPVIPC